MEGEFGPETKFHCPVPGVGSLAAIVAEEVPPLRQISGPASDKTGPCILFVFINNVSFSTPQAFSNVQITSYV